MSDTRVGQLQRLHDITAEQLAAYPSRAIGVLGVAGGNGLDLIDPHTTDAVYGYDINADYLAACAAQYRDGLGDRLRLVETSIDRFLRIERVDLLIANLIVEYVGVAEFVAFASANAGSIGVLSWVIQRNDAAGFVSSTDYASSFDALASVSSDIDSGMLGSAMAEAGFVSLGHWEYPLPNGKTLIREDFRPAPRAGGAGSPVGLARGQHAELLHEGERVRLSPMLGESAVIDPIDRGRGDVERSAGRGNGAQVFGETPAGSDPGYHQVAFGDLVEDLVGARGGAPEDLEGLLEPGQAGG